MAPLSVTQLYQTLYDYFGPQQWWPADNDYQMLIGAILTQNTNWQNVEKALANFNIPLTPSNLLAINQNELAQLIRPSGYHNQKAERILLFSKWLMQYDANINQIKQIEANQLRETLLSLKGIGPETADCMLVYAFDKPFFIIDAYTRRLFTRLGYDVPKKYDNFRIMIEQALGNHFTLEVCNEFHALIIQHGKLFCRAKPECQHCPLQLNCCYYQDLCYQDLSK